MLIVEIKNGESIEKALKKLKRKFDKTKVIKELRKRQAFEKPSVKKRTEKIKAIYIQTKKEQEES